jgi:hypothetical protein
MSRLSRTPLPRITSFAVLVLLASFACEGASQPPDGARGGREVGRVQVEALDEISGLAASRENAGVLWVHDDGDIQRVYAVNTAGQLVARVSLGQETDDCEDLALGPGPGGSDYLYLGDIGDNDQDRDAIRIFRFPEPKLAEKRLGGRSQRPTPAELSARGVERLTLVYPNDKCDAEALLVDPLSGDLLLVTKEKNGARLYRAPAANWGADSPVVLESLGGVAVDKVSAGDISRDGQWILLRREEEGWLWTRDGEQPIADVLRGQPTRVAVLGPTQDDNGEAVAFHPAGGGYYTVSEGKRQPIYFFQLP